MDLSPFDFDRDHLFERQASPFMPEQVLHFRRADLFERAMIQRLQAVIADRPLIEGTVACTAVFMDGALLASAILLGALLDERLWREWMSKSYGPILDVSSRLPTDWRAALQSVRRVGDKLVFDEQPSTGSHLLSSGRIWIDCGVANFKGGTELKRWVADPMTHCLLHHWQAKRAERPPTLVEPDAAIAEFFGAAHWDSTAQAKMVAGLHEAAIVKWRLRMPGFLVGSLGNQGTSVNLPPSRWKAVVGQPAKEAQFDLGKSRTPTVSRDPVHAQIQKALPAGRASPRRMFIDGAATIASAAMANHRTPVERLAMQWAADRLDPSRDKQQRSRGLAPSTIDRRSGVVLEALRFAFGETDPRTLSQQDVVDEVEKLLIRKGDRPSFITHLKCFFDWLQRKQPSIAILINEGQSLASGVSAGILTGREFDRVLARFDPNTASGAASRLELILGFRGGLRWSEVSGLSISDLRFTSDTMELSVRDNSVRRTKSLAGRRLLPLHVLLDPIEVTELRRWWRDRLAAVNRGGRYTALGASTDARLFPASTDEAMTKHARLNHAIREVSGERGANFHTLRHSFGSYLLATLSLPHDLADDALMPRLDPSLVSHERRARLAETLWGAGRLGQNAVHVASSLLGHSGNRSTLRSYMHLTDWLAGVYVARPGAQRGLPTKLVAILLGKTELAVERADRRRAASTRGASCGQSHRRSRGRQSVESTAMGSIYLTPFVDAEQEQPEKLTPKSKIKMRAGPDSVPSWQSMLGVIAADCPATRAAALDRRDIDTKFGRRVIAQLDALLAMPTRGRHGVARPKHGYPSTNQRKRAPRRLDDEQLEMMERLYRGAAGADGQTRAILVDAFVNGYDRPRGVIRVAADAHPIIGALLAIGCTDAEIAVQKFPLSATIRVGLRNRTGRGFHWAMVMISAVHRASCSVSGH